MRLGTFYQNNENYMNNGNNEIRVQPLNPKGDHRQLLCYQKAEVVYDLTYYFANKYFSKADRTLDQMVQAARSCKQNIVEGNAAMHTSSEIGIKLLNVAKASLQELLADYEDYLRVRNYTRWDVSSEEVEAMQRLGRTHQSSAFFLDLASSRSDVVVANMIIVLIHQADALLYKFMQSHYQQYLQEGGFREKLARERKKHRQ